MAKLVSSPDFEPDQTQFKPGDPDEELYEVIEIEAERGSKYKVKWAGVDPKTGKPWSSSWVPKCDCTNDLIQEWKLRKAKKKKELERRKSAAKSAASTVSSRDMKRSASISTTAAARKARQSTATGLAPFMNNPPPSNASGSRDSPSTRRTALTPSRKRRKSEPQLSEDEQDEQRAGPSRPRKKRKLEAEVLVPSAVYHKSPRSSEVSYEVVARKKLGKTAVGSDIDEDEDDDTVQADVASGSPVPAGKRRASVPIDEEEARLSGKEYERVSVPITKIGPPRDLKRPRKSRQAVAEPSRDASSASAELSLSAPKKGRRPTRTTKDTLAGHRTRDMVLSEESDDGEPRSKGISAMARPKPAQVSSQIRRLLVQEEEENTQEAAGFIPTLPDEIPPSRGSLGREKADEPPEQASLEATPPRPARRHGRPFANDTFSRLGIVPATQSSGGPDALDEPPYDPTRDDLTADLKVPSTPVRSRPDGRVSTPTSVVSKMKNIGRGQRKPKELRPMPYLTPSFFKPYLPEDDFEDIEQFSSPERVGGSSIFSMDGARQENPHSPEIPLIQEYPSTSTTQRAEVDCDSQEPSMLNTQIAELNTVLGEKNEMLTQLKDQIEQLQTRIAEMENGHAKENSSHEAELEALRESSTEKQEQISMLESQIVEMHLQVTQLTSDKDNQRAEYEAQIIELNETLEERTEQVEQLECALGELQSAIEEAHLENEKLVAAAAAAAQQQQQQQQIDPPQPQLAQHDEHAARVHALEAQLAGIQEQLIRAEEEAAAHAAAGRETERRLQDAEGDRELLRGVYGEASAHAQRLARENAALEERAGLAEGQARAGLTTVRGAFEQQVGALRRDVDRWRRMYGVLAERDARTDDEVRRQAAREPELVEENAQLRVEAWEARREVERLAGVVAQLSARGRTGEADEQEEEDEEYVPSGGSDGSDDGSTTSSSGSSSGAVSSASIRNALGRLESPEAEDYYVCQHVSGTVMCNTRFLTAQDVISHAYGVHYST